MGTRGFITFVVDGQEKTAYNHWDSYPDGLGVRVLAFSREAARHPAALREAAKRLRVIQADEKPTAEDVERLAPYTDLGVSNQSTDDWYCLLRATQGDPAAILEAGIIEDAGNFPLDSLFAEWGYVIDLDGDGVLEVYRGFQTAPHDKGRFASREGGEPSEYYPVTLAARFALASLPSEEQFLAALKEDEEN
jgi:hypothetical protein